MADTETVLTAPQLGTSAPAGDITVPTAAGAPAVGTASEPEKTPVTEKSSVVAPEKTYTQVEYSKFQSAKDAEVAKVLQRATAAEERLAAIDNAAKEAADKAYLKQVTDAGGDVSVAQKLIEDRKAFEADKAKWAAETTKYQAAAKNLALTELMAAHELDASFAPQLLEAKTPEAMKLKALELQVENLKISGNPSQRITSGVGGRGGVDFSKITDPTAKLSKMFELNIK